MTTAAAAAAAQQATNEIKYTRQTRHVKQVVLIISMPTAAAVQMQVQQMHATDDAKCCTDLLQNITRSSVACMLHLLPSVLHSDNTAAAVVAAAVLACNSTVTAAADSRTMHCCSTPHYLAWFHTEKT
jgi:hypothetical protein